MNVRPETLSFPSVRTDAGPTLGPYYQDFTAALLLVESGYHGGLDADGVPVVRYGDEFHHNPITIAQYALANLDAGRQGDDDRSERARTLCEWLHVHVRRTGEHEGCWTMGFDNPRYPWLRRPWLSALASGNAMSALLRGAEMLGEPRWRDTALLAYEGLHRPRRPRLVVEEGNELWYEEYPREPPIHVLNGHVYALLGVLDVARVTGDEMAQQRVERAVGTTSAALDRFDLGYWSAYEARWREPAQVHYHRNIHVPLLEILFSVSGDDAFAERAERWRLYDRRRWNRARLAWSVRARRFRGGLAS